MTKNHLIINGGQHFIAPLSEKAERSGTIAGSKGNCIETAHTYETGRVRIISDGSAILSDGHVGLVLEIGELAKVAREHHLLAVV
jgi:hypothetical protein